MAGILADLTFVFEVGSTKDHMEEASFVFPHLRITEVVNAFVFRLNDHTQLLKMDAVSGYS